MNLRLFFQLLVFLISANSALFCQHEIDNIFRKYRNDKGVTHYNAKGDISKFLKQSDKNFKTVIDHLDVLVFYKDKDISEKDRGKLKESLTKQSFDQLINIKNKDIKASVHAIDSGPYITKIVAMVSNTEFKFYLTLKGKIHFEELAEMGLQFTPESLNGIFNQGQKTPKP